MYLEVTEGKLDIDWKIVYPVDFWTFRDVFSIQMLEYNPKNCRYPGDDSMRVCTKQNKNKNTRGDGDPEDPCSNKRSRCRTSGVFGI